MVGAARSSSSLPGYAPLVHDFRRSRPLVVVLALAFVAAMAYATWQVLRGRDRLIELVVVPSGQAVDGGSSPIWPVLVVVGLTGALAFAAWWLAAGEEAELGEERAARGEAVQRAERAEAELARTEGELERLAAEAEQERIETERAERTTEQQRSLAQELREQVHELHAAAGGLGDQGDLRMMVLRVAMELVEADRGLLLSRYDDEGDGKLDVVAAAGFDSDPGHSDLAQRFADEVISQGEVIRQTREELDPDEEGGVDAEIENLVAIPIYIRDSFDGVVVCANGDAIDREDEVLLALGDHAGTILENSRLHGELRASYLATVKMLADALEVKDPFLRGHSNEVSGLVKAMAERLELPALEREQLIFGSLLHDIGKIGISERILLKPGPLTKEEFSTIKLHPRIGYRLVAQLPLLQAIAPAILHHHERYDGSGYPAGLAGERIPLEARVIGIIDAFSAMISDRPYQAAVPLEDALAELERCAGTHFDPTLVGIFVEEVRSGGADAGGDGNAAPLLADALEHDPELNALRDAADPMLGFGAFESTDSLTLLRSHRYLREALVAECDRAALEGQERGFVLVVVKVDNMAEVNRELGYAGGDRLLRMLARGLEEEAQGMAALAARESGSRFALLVPSTDPASDPGLADRLRGAVPDPLQARIGVVGWLDTDDAESVVARAASAIA